MSTRQQQAAAKAAKADSASNKPDKPGPVDSEVLAAIKIAIQPVVEAQATIQASQNAMTQKLDQAKGELASIRDKVEALETSVQVWCRQKQQKRGPGEKPEVAAPNGPRSQLPPSLEFPSPNLEVSFPAAICPEWDSGDI